MFIDPNAKAQANTSGVDKKKTDKPTQMEKLNRIAARNGMSPKEAKKVQDLHDKFYEV